MFKTIDLNFLGNEGTIASFLIETHEGPILVETGPHSTLKQLEKGLNQYGYQISDVQHVLLTHIHLDHAGAAWCFAEHGAKIYLHPNGIRHMADPSRLLDSATRIYGDQMDRLWGTLKPIPTEQLIPIGHQETVNFGATKLKSWHTPGHATHHIAWQLGHELFAGDVAGVKISGGPAIPPCPPPDINLEDWNSSMDMIKAQDFEALHLTHYGKVDDPKGHLTELADRLQNWANWIKPHYEDDRPQAEVVPDFEKYVRKQLIDAGVEGHDLARYEGANPSWMSVAGLYRYWKKR